VVHARIAATRLLSQRVVHLQWWQEVPSRSIMSFNLFQFSWMEQSISQTIGACEEEGND